LIFPEIIKAYDIWKNGSDEKNDLTAIIENAKKEKRQIKEANLLDAIARIDELPVFTIHGFCGKIWNYECHRFFYDKAKFMGADCGECKLGTEYNKYPPVDGAIERSGN